jgi:hypothetical protein
MNVHGPSVAIGVSVALVLAYAARRLRPVAVEAGALALDLAKMARAAIELQRENLDDFWCDVQHRSAEQARARRDERMRRDGAGRSTATSSP